MTAVEFHLERGLEPKFREIMERIVKSPKAHWLKDLLAHPDLVPAVRKNSLNFYFCGSSIFRVLQTGEELIANTHYKYLVRQLRKPEYITLGATNRFGLEPSNYVWSEYGPHTLNDIKKAAEVYAGPEKTGLHSLIKGSVNANVCVLDIEINFTRDDNLEHAEDWTEPKTGFDRIDVVTLERAEHAARLVFHEAKHFSNKELRSSGGPPSVVKQIERYRIAIQRHRESILSTYERVRGDIGFISKMRDGATDPATDTRHSLLTLGSLELDPEPRLIIFGFDQDQKEGKVWRQHFDRLHDEFHLTVYAVGDPTSSKGAFGPTVSAKSRRRRTVSKS